MARTEGRWRQVILIAVGIVIGAMLINPAVAHVSTRVGHLWNQHIKPKADNRYINVGEQVSDADRLDGQDSSAFLGSQRVNWAWVDPNGTLDQSRSKGATSATRTATGRYQVTFSRNVRDGCVYIATPFLALDTEQIAAAVFLSETTVLVSTENSAGSAVNTAFSLVVLC